MMSVVQARLHKWEISSSYQLNKMFACRRIQVVSQKVDKEIGLAKEDLRASYYEERTIATSSNQQNW